MSTSITRHVSACRDTYHTRVRTRTHTYNMATHTHTRANGRPTDKTGRQQPIVNVAQGFGSARYVSSINKSNLHWYASLDRWCNTATPSPQANKRTELHNAAITRSWRRTCPRFRGPEGNMTHTGDGAHGVINHASQVARRPNATQFQQRTGFARIANPP